LSGTQKMLDVIDLVLAEASQNIPKGDDDGQ
jgi:hypothetical protein